ncbi:MAG: LVIVD repeat-containing protein [Flavobacterium sp.]
MKKIYLNSFVVLLTLLVSCSQEDRMTEFANVAVPIFKSKTALRESVGVTSPQSTYSDGKVYVAENMLFYIAQEQGIHIFDNSNPAQPQNVAFIQMEGVHDIAVKGNYLYADNFMDLLVFNLSNLQQISLVQTLQDVLEFYPQFPAEADFMAWDSNPDEDDIMIGFQIESRKRPRGQERIWADNAFGAFESQSGGNIGTGGSMARFQINSDALYTVESYRLNVFNIAQPTQVFFDKSIFMTDWMWGGEFETLFMRKEFLFIGATTGMFIINASDAFNPYFVSGFSHATACDPVVVHENTAYITVRGGATCGAIQDQVNVIDITQINNPTLTSTYLLNQPFGLGIKNQVLYVCANQQLHVFNAQNHQQLVLVNSYADGVTDVIPLESHVIAVGPNRVVQYNYGPNHTLIPISTIQL